MKEFLITCRRKDVQHLKVKKITGKKGKVVTKFKVRCSKYLYTLRVDEPDKAEKLLKVGIPNLFFFFFMSLFRGANVFSFPTTDAASFRQGH